MKKEGRSIVQLSEASISAELHGFMPCLFEVSGLEQRGQCYSSLKAVVEVAKSN